MLGRSWFTDHQANPGLAAVKQKWERSGLDIAHLLTVAARDPALGLAFNYGSLLLNNSFFLEGIVSLCGLIPVLFLAYAHEH